MNEPQWAYKLQGRVFTLYRPISYVVILVAALAGLWFVDKGAAETGVMAPAMAQLSGILGGITLLGRLVSRQEARVLRDLSWISLLLVIATVSFVIMGLHAFEPPRYGLTIPGDLQRIVTNLFFIVGGIGFALAMAHLVMLIGRLQEADAPSSESISEEE